MPSELSDEMSHHTGHSHTAFDYKAAFFGISALIGIPLALWYRLSTSIDPTTGSFQYQPQNLLELAWKIVTICSIFCLVGLVFWGIEQIWPDEEDQKVTREDTWLNGLYILINQCLMVRVAATVLAAVATAIIFCHIPRLPSTWITYLPVGLQVIGIAVLKDFLGYWNHRLFHTVPMLWRFHAVHHSSEELHWFSATREHPFEQIVGKLVTVLPLYLLGFKITVLGAFSGAWVIYLMFLHSNTRCSFGPLVRYLVVSPTFHRWHHSNDEHILDKNFATLLPIWDFIFGTAYLPKVHHTTTYGLYKETIGNDFWSQLIYPFVYPFRKHSKEGKDTPAGINELHEQVPIHQVPAHPEYGDRQLMPGGDGVGVAVLKSAIVDPSVDNGSINSTGNHLGVRLHNR